MAKVSTDLHSSCDSNDRSARESIGRSKVDLIEDDPVMESKVWMCESVDDSSGDDHCEPTRSNESKRRKGE
jgi:hypothetical protein